MLFSDDYLKKTMNKLLAIRKCNCSKKYINTSSESSLFKSFDSDIKDILYIKNIQK